MTGEEILRALAEERKQELARTPPEHKQSVMLNARPFLIGAFHALCRAKALENPPSLELLEEVLAPIEQPLVDQGVIERVSFGLEDRANAHITPDEDPER
ncbi:MAG: hypothetical protein ACRD0C_21710 [Acidimicrobiia bacterium]